MILIRILESGASLMVLSLFFGYSNRLYEIFVRETFHFYDVFSSNNLLISVFTKCCGIMGTRFSF